MIKEPWYIITYATEDLAKHRCHWGVGNVFYTQSKRLADRESSYAECVKKVDEVTVLDLIAAGELDEAVFLMWNYSLNLSMDACRKEVRRIASKWGIPTNAVLWRIIRASMQDASRTRIRNFYSDKNDASTNDGYHLQN